MKSRGLILILALSLPTLAGCARPEPVISQETPFDALARWVPGDATQVFFLNLDPDGEAGRHWTRIRRHLEAHPMGQELLNALSHQFKVEGYGLGELVVGPAVNWYDRETDHVIAQVSDDEATRDALLQHFERVTWEQEEYDDKTLYHGRPRRVSSREWLAWAVHDGLLFLSVHYDQESLTGLRELLDLAQEDSLTALPAWRTLRDRLPETPMGLLFFNVAEQARRNPPAPDDASPGETLIHQIEALAYAVVPEEGGVRLEIAGTVAPQADASPEACALFNLPAVSTTSWPSLPASTAIALIAPDAHTIWPLLKEIFFAQGSASDQLARIRDTVGLDLEADLAGADGPLTGDFALAITPPLPDQPISEGLPAGQLLILSRSASEAQMTDVQAAMESRGAVFGPREVEDLALQTQTGTELTGYAISYGFDGDTMLFGSSPDIIAQAAATRRDGGGLVTSDSFQALLAASPDAPTLVVYFNSEPLTGMLQTNMTEEEYRNREEHALLEVFEAVGVALRFAADGIDGVAYCFVPE